MSVNPVDATLGDHLKRIRALEASQASGIEYAIVEDNIIGNLLPAGPTTHLYWWDMTAPASTEFTNAPDTFTIETDAVPASATNVNSGTFHGLSIHKPGMYLAFKTNQIVSLYTDTTLRAISTYQHQNFPSYTSDMVFGDQNHINQGHGFHMEIWSVLDGAPAIGPVLLASANGESAAYHCDVSLLLIRMPPTGIAL